MKYRLESSDNLINIEVSGAKDKQGKLLDAFRECQEGRCSCPTQEYSKLDSLEIDSSEDTIHLKLKSKTGQSLDEAEIRKCVEYTNNMLQNTE